MATFQAYQAYAQNKGTLVPGQSITVNKYTVQVERYLAQGGFAHVYLVRTATPVYNTTHHVLKRIAVANEAMLAEVKKEVDIMRILMGHPNIVHLVDAAWHRLPNGQYEVFILMEFCPGGGIIDMMNRRLRERLTEAEILQIFVDVCEGVAAMHNLRPPLLHRDLKVENILQSTPTSFKLCDFGSATSVAPRPPATTQEIRELEADLNRHTTLQYRAPEMVDPFLRRPVDEKSDVWALGVLLYKLCYYTTPFEEHGPLAILNVQYRIPPYPVYSAQINSLIASILREHSAQRPSAFELLSTVHGLRGTKSPFQYTIAISQPLSPRHLRPQPQFQAQITSRMQSRQSYEPSVAKSTSTSKKSNAGIQARDKVLEAIAPMRRGRPSKEPPAKSRSRPSSPQKLPEPATLGLNTDKGKSTNWLDGGFGAEDEAARRAAISMGSGAEQSGNDGNDAWGVKAGDAPDTMVGQAAHSFDDDFESKLLNAFDRSALSTDAYSKPPTTTYRPPAFTGSEAARSTATAMPKVKTKDAFGDLGLSISDRSSPTLGEARKLRTGLAIMNTNKHGINYYNTAADRNKSGTPSARPTPSPRPSYLSSSPSQFQPSPKASSTSTWIPPNQPLLSKPSSLLQPDGLPAESRFPSLEELDASFVRRTSPHSFSESQPQSSDKLLQPPSLPSRGNIGSSGTGDLSRPIVQWQSSYNRDQDGVKSEQVTGVAMRDSRVANRRAEEPPNEVTRVNQGESSRPTLTRKHRSTFSMKQTSQPNVNDIGQPGVGPRLELPNIGISASQPSPRAGLKDWLTGDDDDDSPHAAVTPSSSALPETPPRDSPGKRTSFLESSFQSFQAPPDVVQDAVTSSQLPTSMTLKSTTTSTSTSRISRTIPQPIKTVAHNKPSRFLKESWSPVATSAKEQEKDFSVGIIEPTTVKSTSQKKPSLPSKECRSPVTPTSKVRENDSSSDEGPEDVNGYMPSTLETAKFNKEEQTRRSGKGRQSSVHDLVDLWGGAAGTLPSNSGTGSNVDTNIKAHKRRPTSSVSASSLTQQSPKLIPRSTSPQPMLSAPADARLTSRLPKLPLPEPERHRKQPSTAGSTQSPVSTRSRPQSMFLFPVSKANSDGTPGTTNTITSPGLSPPEEPKPRAGIRRISISDMVQLYETIGGKANGPGPPTTLKVIPQQTESGGYSKAQAGKSLVPPRGNNVPESRIGSSNLIPNDLHGSTEPKTNRTSPTRTTNTTTFPTSPAGHRDVVRPKEADLLLQPKVRPYRKSTASNEFTPDPLDTNFPSRKSTASTEELPKLGDGRSPSPERPYQGVGKLIDQWQRKTAEADSSRNPRSSRRGGLVGNGKRGR